MGGGGGMQHESSLRHSIDRDGIILLFFLEGWGGLNVHILKVGTVERGAGELKP